MIDEQFFTDFLFLALHLIPLAVNCASDFSLWFANRFRTDSNACQNIGREKQPLVFYTPNHAPLLLPPASTGAHRPHLTVPLSQYLALNQGTNNIHIHVHLESPNNWIDAQHTRRDKVTSSRA